MDDKTYYDNSTKTIADKLSAGDDIQGTGKPKRRFPRRGHPGTELDQKLANQTPIHTTGEVRGRTPIHIVTN